VVTGSPASVVSAIMLGGNLRTLLSADGVTDRHSLLTTESRVRMIVYTLGIYCLLLFLFILLNYVK